MAQTPSNLQRYQSEFQAFEKSQAVNGAAWLAHLRRQAFSRFEELGFPTARRGNERWKYTSVAPIARGAFALPLDAGHGRVAIAELRRHAPWDDGWINLVFVDGRFDPGISTGPLETDGVQITNLADAIGSNGDLVERHLARYASIEQDAFAALNTAFIRDGALIHLGEGSSPPAPVQLVYVSTDSGHPTVSYPRTLIVAGRNTQATVIESYVTLSGNPYLTDATTEIALAEGANLLHYRYLMESAKAYHVGVTRVHQGRDSTFSSTSLARGAALARNELHVLLDAPGARCFLKGLYVTLGSEHIDHHINIDHLKPSCTSDQYFKGILGGKSRAVYSGRVVVHRDAQKTFAYQKDLNLILSEGAEVDTKPSLEIYADDVKCGHGATAGAMAEEALFYMRSRGLDLDTARTLLIHGFAREIIDTVRIDPLREYLEEMFLRSIPATEFGEAA